MYQDGMQGSFNAPPPMPMPSGGTASSTGDNPNVPVAHYNPATAVRPGAVGVAAPSSGIHPAVHAAMSLGQQMGLFNPPPPPAPPDPWSNIFGDAISKALGLKPQGQAAQTPSGAPPGLQANTLPYLGGAQTGNIPNAKPGDVQGTPLNAPGADPNSIQTEGDFAKALLQYVGAPASAGNIQAIVQQEQAEEGSWTGTPVPDKYNPLNTGQQGFGGIPTGDPTQGLQAFPNWASGVAATGTTLEGNASKFYAPALQALRNNDPAGYLNYIAQSGWAGSHYGGGASFAPANQGNLKLSPGAAAGNFPKGPYPNLGGQSQATGDAGPSGGGGGGGGGGTTGGGGAAGGGGTPSGRASPVMQTPAALTSMFQIPMLAGQMDAASILQNPILSQILGGGGASGANPNDPYNFIDQILGGQ